MKQKGKHLVTMKGTHWGLAMLMAKRWETSLEIDNLGFNLYRSEIEDGPAIRINDNLIPSQAPGGLTGASYTYMDHSAAPDKTYYYWLEMLQIDGSRLRFGPIVATPPDEEMIQLFLPIIIH